MSPVCVACQVEMRVVKNDYCVEEMADAEHPYRVWFTDLWGCQKCGVKVVVGFARQPWGEYWQPDYQQKAKEADLRYWPRADMVPAAKVAEPSA